LDSISIDAGSKEGALHSVIEGVLVVGHLFQQLVLNSEVRMLFFLFLF